MSRPTSIRSRILIALTDEPIDAPQLAQRAGITARRRGEVVRLACGVLEGEGLVERVGGGHHPKWRRPTVPSAKTGSNSASPRFRARRASGPDERLAHELIQGLVQSAVATGGDPVARLQEFRTLQQAAIALSDDATLTGAAETLVRAIDCGLQRLTAVES